MKKTSRFWFKRRYYWVAALMFLITLIISAWVIGSPPPRRIVFATGDPAGGFALLGLVYKTRLERMGLKVELVESRGSYENLQKLRLREVDVAFVQGGIVGDKEELAGVCGLAAVCSEPLWIFARSPLTSLRDLRGQRIGLGPEVSATDTISRQLLKEFGINDTNSTLVNRSMSQVQQALHDRFIDAAMLIASPNAPVIRTLILEKDVHLVNLKHQKAISRRLPFLRPVTIPESTLDLDRNLPPRDTAMVAPITTLAACEDLHPRVVEQLLVAARVIHSGGDLLENPGQFPSLDGVELPVHITAEKFMRSGESYLSRVLPYRAMRMIWQAQLLVLPLLALLPLWKALPLLYSFRINQILKHHYAALGEIEARIQKSTQPEELQGLIESLNRLRGDLEKLSRKMPVHLQRDIYHWRLHVTMVRDEVREKLARLAGTTGNGEVAKAQDEKAGLAGQEVGADSLPKEAPLTWGRKDCPG